MCVHPQPARPVKADSGHNIVVASVDLGGQLAHKPGQYDKPTEAVVVEQV